MLCRDATTVRCVYGESENNVLWPSTPGALQAPSLGTTTSERRARYKLIVLESVPKVMRSTGLLPCGALTFAVQSTLAFVSPLNSGRTRSRPRYAGDSRDWLSLATIPDTNPFDPKAASRPETI